MREAVPKVKRNKAISREEAGTDTQRVKMCHEGGLAAQRRDRERPSASEDYFGSGSLSDARMKPEKGSLGHWWDYFPLGPNRA